MNEDAPDHAVEDLRELLVHPGWKRLLHYVHGEWGAKAVMDRCRVDAKAGMTHLLPQEIAVADGIFHVLAWPVTEIGKLEEEKRKAKAREHEPLVRRRA